MKAKCPHCAGKPPGTECYECRGSGYIEVTFAQGEVYSVVCTNPDCGLPQGGFIVGSSSPYKAVEDRGPLAPCLKCGSPTEARRTGETP